MSEIRRYKVSATGFPVRRVYGDFVFYTVHLEAVARLEGAIDDYQKANRRLMREIAELEDRAESADAEWQAKVEGLARTLESDAERFEEMSDEMQAGEGEDFQRGYKIAWGRSAAMQHRAIGEQLRSLASEPGAATLNPDVETVESSPEEAT